MPHQKSDASKSKEEIVKASADEFRGMTTRDALAYWIALPSKTRDPATQKELAALLGVSEERLCQIKRDNNFKALVMEYRKIFFKQFTSDIIQAMVLAAKGGNERAAKLYLQYIEDFQESTKQTIDKTETRKFVFELPPERLRELRGQLKALKRIRENEFVEEEPIKGELVEGSHEEIPDTSES